MTAEEKLLLDAAWAFRHMHGEKDDRTRSEAYRIAVQVQDYETEFLARRPAR